ncbi:hypothetical protein KIPB_004770 [Kipferlia bialata]|uniref:Uncharacterized protein n=1 Tax=Kipferlia bialata TaxID=797122 RepID=A0A9K3CUA5_9EUKA|nr:hypothetical protein KIPB_004770 [Kipferlia bialata]|eukprot:g4770.t1
MPYVPPHLRRKREREAEAAAGGKATGGGERERERDRGRERVTGWGSPGTRGARGTASPSATHPGLTVESLTHTLHGVVQLQKAGRGNSVKHVKGLDDLFDMITSVHGTVARTSLPSSLPAVRREARDQIKGALNCSAADLPDAIVDRYIATAPFLQIIGDWGIEQLHKLERNVPGAKGSAERADALDPLRQWSRDMFGDWDRVHDAIQPFRKEAYLNTLIHGLTSGSYEWDTLFKAVDAQRSGRRTTHLMRALTDEHTEWGRHPMFDLWPIMFAKHPVPESLEDMVSVMASLSYTSRANTGQRKTAWKAHVEGLYADLGPNGRMVLGRQLVEALEGNEEGEHPMLTDLRRDKVRHSRNVFAAFKQGCKSYHEDIPGPLGNAVPLMMAGSTSDADTDPSPESTVVGMLARWAQNTRASPYLGERHCTTPMETCPYMLEEEDETEERQAEREAVAAFYRDVVLSTIGHTLRHTRRVEE